MKLIVGLGNPGEAYQRNLHNTGFMMLDQLAMRLGSPPLRKKFYSVIAKSHWAGADFILMKPMNFMNNSGQAVSACQQFFNISTEEIAVIYDDLDLPLGMARFRLNGGHGGHNGVRSIIQHLGTEDFKRVRLGIGRPPTGMDPMNYVLSNWKEVNLQKMQELQSEVIDGLIRFISNSIFENTSFSLAPENR